MWHSLNIQKLVRNILFPYMRKPFIVLFLKAAMKPFVSVYQQWTILRTNNLYTLSITSQQCYIKKMLNDNFDNILRRIQIVEPVTIAPTYIYMEGEAPPVYTDFTIHTDDELIGFFDFVVEIPYAIWNVPNNVSHITALINEHKLTTKRWTVSVPDPPPPIIT